MEGTAEDPLATCRELERLGRAHQEGSPWRGTTCDAPPEAVAYYYRKTAQIAPASFGAWDFTTSLSGLAAPLLVVAGEANAELQCAWARAVPDARLLVVPGTGSTPIAERPDVVHPAIDRFLRGRWPRETADCQLEVEGTLPAP
jgi:pimeloyl-ACP methyl ester carboxylesterase